jgi:hypothetical protein
MLTVKAKHLPGSKSIQSFKRQKKMLSVKFKYSSSYRVPLLFLHPGLGPALAELKQGVVP